VAVPTKLTIITPMPTMAAQSTTQSIVTAPASSRAKRPSSSSMRVLRPCRSRRSHPWSSKP